MTTQRPANRTFEESLEDLKAEDPNLRQALEEDEGAFVVARELLRCRREAGISQTELAKRMGTTQPVISRLERMETDPSIGQVFRAARALGKKPVLRFEEASPVEGELHDPDELRGHFRASARRFLDLLSKTSHEHSSEEAMKILGADLEHQVVDSFVHRLADIISTEGVTFRVRLPRKALIEGLEPDINLLDDVMMFHAAASERIRNEAKDDVRQPD